MSSINRRTLMQFLGLAPAAAIGTETALAVPKEKKDMQTGAGDCTDELIIGALRKFISGIQNKQISIETLSTHSRLAANEVHKHSLEITFVYFPEVEDAPSPPVA